MKNVNWMRLTVASATAFGLVAMSSSASAQLTKRQYCSQYARSVCSVDENGRPQQLTLECYEPAWTWCMNDFAKLDVRTPGDYDKRRA